MPCIQTGTGICHVYVDEYADLDKAVKIIVNAKTSRPSVCNAEEVCLVHSAVAERFLPMLRKALVEDRAAAGQIPVELRLDPRAAAVIPGTPAGPADFDTEFLDYILAVRVVDSVDEAIEHIQRPLHPPQRGHRHGERRQRGRNLSTEWTARRCTSTSPPGSPTAASSALAARWEFPPRSSMPAARWGWTS